MNTLIVGFLLIAGILITAFEGNAGTYLQLRSVAIVIGGTFAVLFFSNPGTVLRSLSNSVVSLFKKDEGMKQYQTTLNDLIKNKNATVPADTHSLIRYAADLWQQGIDPDLFVALLSQKRADLTSFGVDAVMAMKNLAKYPPALGMTGTVMGIISVFYNLDQNKEGIGLSLSVAMTATFFGLILSNLLIAPLADRLFIRQIGTERTCEGLYEILILINRQEPATLIHGEMNERAA
jgi:chemotaxis protein MotA